MSAEIAHTAIEVTEDNENTLSSDWNFLDLFKLEEFKIYNKFLMFLTNKIASS